MKIVNKSRPPVTLDLSESGEIIAVDIHGHPVPLRMRDALRARFQEFGRYPSQDPKPGTVMPDGTIYAGVSPNTRQPIFTTPLDAATPMSWSQATIYAKTMLSNEHIDWRIPTLEELHVLFNNRTVIGGFNSIGRFPSGHYWSSRPKNSLFAWNARFSDGTHWHQLKFNKLSVRIVRG